MVKGVRFNLPATLTIIDTFKDVAYCDNVHLEPINTKDYWLVVDGERLFEGRKVDLMHALMLGIYACSKDKFYGIIDKFKLDKYAEVTGKKRGE